MEYEVGQQICNGQVIIATVDTNNMIISVVVPQDQDINHNPLTITYNYGVTENVVENLLGTL